MGPLRIPLLSGAPRFSSRDVDGDGLDDLALSASISNETYIFRNASTPGSFAFELLGRTPSAENIEFIELLDLNGRFGALAAEDDQTELPIAFERVDPTISENALASVSWPVPFRLATISPLSRNRDGFVDFGFSIFGTSLLQTSLGEGVRGTVTQFSIDPTTTAFAETAFAVAVWPARFDQETLGIFAIYNTFQGLRIEGLLAGQGGEYTSNQHRVAGPDRQRRSGVRLERVPIDRFV
ncbi:MAG: hypothetical protein AAF658_07205 [Myxococcota bacterium]